jgi:hypothetical protein
MRLLAKAVLVLSTMAPLMAQAAPQTIAVPCAVRIRPRAAADYDPSSELVLAGTVIAAQPGSLRLQLGYGTVRVDLGGAVPAVVVGQDVAVTVSRLQDDLGQRFVARELRSGEVDQVLRDAEGVPVS